MKGNIKKLSVFAIIAAIAMFVVVGMALADQHFPKAIHGAYDATVECACMVAPLGFNTDLTPKNNAGSVSIHNRTGIWTFEKDGTGSATANGSQISLSYVGPNGPVPPIPSSYTFSLDFTYTVTPDGIITITPGIASVIYTSGPNKNLTYQSAGSSSKGTITPNGKIITTFIDASDLATLSGPGLPPVSPNSSCTCIGVFTRQHDEED